MLRSVSAGYFCLDSGYGGPPGFLFEVVGGGFDLHRVVHAVKKFLKHETADLFYFWVWVVMLAVDGT